MAREWLPLQFSRERCDLCHRIARWRHPAGGLRCNLCPTPGGKTDSPEIMRTAWGKRRGWELQRVTMSDGKVFWRVSERNGGIHAATPQEIALWRFLPSHWRTPIKKVKR